jgi:hypothetical protein
MYLGLYKASGQLFTGYLINSAILTTANWDVAAINNLLFDVFPGQITISFSTDVPTTDMKKAQL